MENKQGSSLYIGGDIQISVDEFKRLCQDQECLNMIRDYLDTLAKDDIESVHIDILAVMAGISDEITELRREREANDGKS